MRLFILETSRELLQHNPTADLDEIAACAGIKRSHIEAYFESIDDLRAAITAEYPDSTGLRPASKQRPVVTSTYSDAPESVFTALSVR